MPSLHLTKNIFKLVLSNLVAIFLEIEFSDKNLLVL
jgi:hypothetical protein